MKAFKKLIPALAMLLFSAVLLGTSTFAWFSMNDRVTVTGMTVNTKVSSNLLVAHDTLDSVAKKGENLFLTADTTDLGTTQLEPVSTKNGKAFFYTVNALPNGDAVTDDYVVYNAAEVPTSSENTTFNENYGTTGAVGYKDYVFQLKAVNADTTNSKDIKITKLDLVYAGAVDAGKAWRAAIFVEEITSGTATAGAGTLLGIYAPNGGNNQTPNAAIGAAATAPSALTSNYNTVSNIATVAAGTTKYYKVVVRLYLEGEDTTCKNDTYATLTQGWQLRLELAIDTPTTTNTAVSYISTYKTATVSTTTYYYDGSTYYWTDIANIGTTTGRNDMASADAAVKTAFGLS